MKYFLANICIMFTVLRTQQNSPQVVFGLYALAIEIVSSVLNHETINMI